MQMAHGEACAEAEPSSCGFRTEVEESGNPKDESGQAPASQRLKAALRSLLTMASSA